MKQALKAILKPVLDLCDNEKISEFFIDKFDDIYYGDYSSGKLEIKNFNSPFKTEVEFEKFCFDIIEFFTDSKEIANGSYHFSIDEFSKIHLVTPKINSTGFMLNFMRLPKNSLTWEDFLKFDAITAQGRDLILNMMKENKNIVVAGPVGSGKTTLLNLITNSINPDYRVVVVEKELNLVINRKMTARLRSNHHQSSLELLKTAHNMRADYLVVDDLKGQEVSEFLDYLAEGFSGISMISADNVYDALKRLELWALKSGAMPIESVRNLIAKTINFIVFQEKCEDGKRRVTKIAKVIATDSGLGLELIYKI